jgi:hypothetical protein
MEAPDSSRLGAEFRRIPRLWRKHEDRDPEAEARALKKRFAKVSARLDRPAKLKRVLAKLRVPALAVSVASLSLIAGAEYRNWSVPALLRHMAALPNCSAARAVGLGNAREGEPGYYSGHDRDGDGISCEPWTN